MATTPSTPTKKKAQTKENQAKKNPTPNTQPNKQKKSNQLLAPNTPSATHRSASEASVVASVQRATPLVIEAANPAAAVAAAAHTHAATEAAAIPTASHPLPHASALAKAAHAVAVVAADARHAPAVREEAANYPAARAAQRTVSVARRADHAPEDAPDPAANPLARAHTFAATLRAIFVVAAADSAALRTGVAVFIHCHGVLRRFFIRQKVQIRVVFRFFVGRLRSNVLLLAVFLLVHEHSCVWVFVFFFRFV